MKYETQRKYKHRDNNIFGVWLRGKSLTETATKYELSLPRTAQIIKREIRRRQNVGIIRKTYEYNARVRP